MSMTAAQLRRMQDELRVCVLMEITEDATEEDGRVEADVDVLGYDDEGTVVEVLGGMRGPFGLPRKGELWFGALLGQGLNDGFALLPLTRFDSEDLPISELGVTAWTPPKGERIHIESREAAIDLISGDKTTFQSANDIEFKIGALSFKMTKSGKISMGSTTVEVVDALSQSLGFLSATCQDLASTTVATMLGPSPLITAPLFAARKAQIEALKLLVDSIKG